MDELVNKVAEKTGVGADRADCRAAAGGGVGSSAAGGGAGGNGAANGLAPGATVRTCGCATAVLGMPPAVITPPADRPGPNGCGRLPTGAAAAPTAAVIGSLVGSSFNSSVSVCVTSASPS